MKKIIKLYVFALFIILISPLFLSCSGGNDKVVPIYEGMSLSKTNEYLDKNKQEIKKKNHNDHYDGDYKGNDQEINYDDPFGNKEQGKDSLDKIINDEIKVNGNIYELFCSEDNGIVYMNIHFHNPDKFEILSFTLNGVKYTSYMFEEGSDLENLIVKLDVEDYEGIVEYTIDAIKYVDGEKIKDVKINGNQTIKFGVTYKNLPKILHLDEEISYNSFNLSFKMVDIGNVIKKSNGETKLVIYDGKEIVQISDVKVGDNSFDIKNLKTKTLYQYAIYAYYDNFDGDGFFGRLVHTNSFYTQSILLFDNIELSRDSINFDFLWNEKFNNKSIISIDLYLDDELIDSKADISSFKNLLSNSKYSIIVKYYNGKEIEEIRINFNTFETKTPSLNIVNLKYDQENISFEIDEVDEDNVGEIDKILLKQNNEIIAEVNSEIRSFSNLLSDNEYEIVVQYTYDLNEGNGSVTKEISQKFTTNKKERGTFTFDVVSSNQENIYFTLNENDIDDTAEITKIELIKDGKVEQTIENDVREFNNLLSNNEYIIKVTYENNLNNGEEVLTDVITTSITTKEKVKGTLIFNSISADQENIYFDFIENDIDGTGTIEKIELINNGIIVQEIDGEASSFNNLLSNNEYTVKVYYVIDLNDGKNVTTEIITEDILTLAKKEGSISLDELKSEQESISFVVNEIDHDDTGTISKIELIHDGVIIETYNGDVREFTNLLSNNDYTIKIYYDIDLNDGNGPKTIQIFDDIYTKEKSIGKFEIKSITSGLENIEFTIEEDDEDNTAEIIKIELLHNGNVVEISGEEIRKYSDLLSNNEYIVKLTYKYNLNDGKGDFVIVKSKSIRTLEKEKPIFNIDNVVTDIRDVKFDVSYNDSYNVLDHYEVYLSENKENIISDKSNNKSVEFNNLKFGHNYYINIKYFYDLNDGQGIVTSIHSIKFTTKLFIDEQNISYQINDNNEIDVVDGKNAIGNIIIPESIEGYSIVSISKDAFLYNRLLTNISLPKTLETINTNAFVGCIKLKYIFIPKSVTMIGRDALSTRKEIQGINILFEEGICKDYFYYDYTDFDAASVFDNITKLIVNKGILYAINIYNQAIAIEIIEYNPIIEIPEIVNNATVTILGNSLFSEVNKEFDEIILPDTITTISKRAFSNVVINQTSLDLPANISTIEDDAFGACTISYYNFVNPIDGYIGSYAFYSDYIKFIEIPLNSAVNIDEWAIRSDQLIYFNVPTNAVVSDNSITGSNLEIYTLLDRRPTSWGDEWEDGVPVHWLSYRDRYGNIYSYEKGGYIGDFINKELMQQKIIEQHYNQWNDNYYFIDDYLCVNQESSVKIIGYYPCELHTYGGYVSDNQDDIYLTSCNKFSDYSLNISNKLNNKEIHSVNISIYIPLEYIEIDKNISSKCSIIDEVNIPFDYYDNPIDVRINMSLSEYLQNDNYGYLDPTINLMFLNENQEYENVDSIYLCNENYIYFSPIARNLHYLDSIEVEKDLEVLYNSQLYVKNIYYRGNLHEWLGSNKDVLKLLDNTSLIENLYVLDDNNEWIRVNYVEIPSGTEIVDSYDGLGKIDNIIIPNSVKEIHSKIYADNIYYKGTVNEWFEIINNGLYTSYVKNIYVLNEIGEYYNINQVEDIYISQRINTSLTHLPNLKNIYFDGTIDEFIIEYNYSMPRHLDKYNIYINGELLEYFRIDNIEYCGTKSDPYVAAICCYDVITEVILQNNCRYILENAFMYSGIKNFVSSDNLIYIGEGAFYDTDIENVLLKDKLEIIEESAFSNCTYLSGIVFPESLTYIGPYAFSYCSSLRNINIHDNVTYIGDSAFYYSGISGEIVIPETNVYLGTWSFEGCYKITSVTLPSYDYNLRDIFGETVKILKEINVLSGTKIPYSYYQDCISIKDIYISKDIMVIEHDAFYNCTSLKNVYYNGTIEEWCKIIFYINSNPMCYAENFYILNAENNWIVTSKIDIPNTIDKINNYTFIGFDNVTNIIIPDTISTIGDNAFADCVSLETIVIPNSVTKIGYSILKGCANLKTISIPFIGDSKEGTGTFCFGYLFGAYNHNWQEEYIPNNLKNIIITSDCFIAPKAFFGMKDLNITITDENVEFSENDIDYSYTINTISMPANINLPRTAITVTITSGESIYINERLYTQTVRNITIPSSVKLISENVFSKCTNLENVYYAGTLDDWCNIEFVNQYSNPMSYASHFYLLDENNEWYELTEIIVSDKVENIGNYQFYGFENITNIIIPNTISYIGNHAFEGCNNVESISLPFIGQNSDSNIYNFGYIFGAEKYFDNEKFVPATLREVNITGETVIYSNSFYNCTNIVNIFVNENIFIQDNAFTGCNLLEFTEYDNCLYLGSKENQYLYLIEVKEKNATKVKINENCIIIGCYAFKNCLNLQEIILPNSILCSYYYAYMGCDSLEIVYYNGTFDEFNNIYFVGINSNPMYNGAHLFILNENNEFYEYIDLLISDEVNTIDYIQYYGYKYIKNITIPNTITSIGAYAFYGCESLENVYFCGTMEQWCNIEFTNQYSNPMHNGAHLFILNENNEFYEITEIDIPDGSSKIQEYQFSGYKYVNSITIPSSITSIGSNAFYGCKNLENVYFTGTIEEWFNIIYEDIYSNPMNNGAHLYILNENNEYYEITEIVISDGESKIQEYQFLGYEYLNSITIPSSIISIDSNAFYGCKNLENVYFTGTIVEWFNITYGNEYSNAMIYGANLYLLDEYEKWNLFNILSTPTNVVCDYKQIRWNNVNEAVKYEVTINDITYYTENNYFIFESIGIKGCHKYNVKIKCLGVDEFSCSKSVIYQYESKNIATLNNGATADTDDDEYKSMANHMLDENDHSRWESSFKDNIIVSITLDKIYSIFGLYIYWEAANAEQYIIEVSADGTEWVNVFEYNEKIGQNPREDNVFFENSIDVKYIKINCIKRSTNYGFSIYTFKAFSSL